MDMNGQWPVSPWDFASGPSRSYSQPARSPILHRSPLTSQCVPWWMPHVNRDTLLYSQPSQVSNMPKTVLCQVQYIAQRLFAPFLYWSSEDFWNRWIQGGTKTIKQCHCQRWHLGFGKLAVPLGELVIICTRWHGLLGSHSHEPMFPCFHLPPSY